MNTHHLTVFLQIVDKGSMRAAAKELGLSPATVSENLATLESHYGVVLLNRTTRSVSLTEEGRVLAEGARRLLDEIQYLDSQIRLGAESLSGLIRISSPIDIGRNLVVNVIDQFIKDYPNVVVEADFYDGFVDMIGSGIDLALRFGFVRDSSLRIRSVANITRIVCASPAYIKAHGEPQTPEDLQAHNCLIMRFGRQLDNVWYLGQGNAKQEIKVSGNRIANDSELMRNWCINGYGIMMKSELDIKKDIDEKRLVPLLTQYSAEPTPLQLLYPPSRAQPKRVCVFSEYLIAEITKRVEFKSHCVDIC
ncbi:LysR family transcriptional regulator [Agarilytica rhodophyticola]|uniref:LysR family transcriptional regulator n=1 Tax=Agarilytica rhodophyticola TaxID=1737490 RepID=UPI000B34134C|nr:LysR family transcriptional regulator [Agarilytica rhodophyticola]